MPELPEVEAARRAIEEHCVGKKIIKSIIADDSKVIDTVPPKDFEASLNGKTIVAAYRKGKNMWIQLDSPPFPSFQFGMAGAIYIKGVAVTKYKRSAVKDTDEWPSKYSKFFIELNDGLELSFTDKRRFAKVRLLDNPIAVPPISELGSDALLEPMTVDEFYSKLRKKNIGIKALLLDQGFMSGIGNWIADEVLYQARIHPLQIACSMTKESCGTLLGVINEVISKAVEVGADSSQYPSNWIFHFREKKPGKAFIDGKKIEFISAGGRTTAYVPDVQKLSGAQATKVAAKASKGSAKRTKENNGDDEVDEAEIEEEAKSRSAKVVGGKKTRRDKKAPSKVKFNGGSKGGNIDGDGGSSSDDEKTSARKKTKTTAKNALKNQKPVGSDDSAEDENEDQDDNGGDQKNAREAKVGKTSRKKDVSSRNRKQTKKKAK